MEARITKKLQTKKHDIAERLRTAEEMALYLDACIEESEGDAAFIAKALGDIARAQGMTKIAKETGMSRESLYKASQATDPLISRPYSKSWEPLALRYTQQSPNRRTPTWLRLATLRCRHNNFEV